MKIVSATMAGRGTSKESLARAIKSVKPFVDDIYVLDTGLEFDADSISATEGWETFSLQSERWVNDFASMRNKLLRRAWSCTGASSIVMLDSDETLKPQGVVDLRTFLAGATGDTYSVEHVSRHYGKPRIFRAPVKGKFTGPTHEAYETAGEPCPLFLFDEEEKAPAEYRAKFERDRNILLHHLKSSPENPGRWHFYLGETYASLSEPRKAIEQHKRCVALSKWDEERAWSQMRIAQELQKLEEWDEAVEACAHGLAIYPGMPELAEQAALASCRAGKWLWAVYWANMALAVAEPRAPRGGFRYESSHSEGPYDVLRHAYAKMGNVEKAEWAQEQFDLRTFRKGEGYDAARVEWAGKQMQPGGPITITQTACKRPDLFERTVDSFLKSVDDLSLVSRWIVVDDGTDEDALRTMRNKYPFLEIYTKLEKGHAKSLNLLFGDLVRTLFAFHLEDDWQFVGPFSLRECMEVLEEDSSYGQCLVNRNFAEERRGLEVAGPAAKRTAKGLSYVEHEHFPDGKYPYSTWHQGHWPGFSLHPSLIWMPRLRELLPFVESFVEKGFEYELATRWFESGVKTTFLDTLHAVHIGKKTYETGKPNAYSLNNERQY